MPRTLLQIALLTAAVATAAEPLDRYQQWLADVDPLITKQERKAFRALDEDYQRDAFIERFWAVRDRSPETRANEFRDRYYVRLETARGRYGPLKDDRSRVFALNGEPDTTYETDCGVLTWPLELWTYRYAERANRSVELIFYQPNGGGPFRIWNPAEGHAAILMTLDGAASLREQRNAFHRVVGQFCAEIRDEVGFMLAIFTRVEIERSAGAIEAARSPQSLDPEWIAGFHAFSTRVSEDAPPLVADFAVSFVGPHQSRTRVRGAFDIERGAARAQGDADAASYNFQLTGEVLRDELLFESFRYRFDLPAGRIEGDRLPVDFERALRPGLYRWVLKLEDLNGGGVWREEVEIEVPTATTVAAVPEPAVASAAADEAEPGVVSISLGDPLEEVVSGAVRFTATVSGEGVAKVRFSLDGRPLLTKTRPPYSVELQIGGVPRAHRVRAVALGPDGKELATDEALLNPGRQSFVVRIVEPREGAAVGGRVRVRAEVARPEGMAVDRVELFVGEERRAVLYQPPYLQSLDIGTSTVGYLRAVAHLVDGGQTEDLIVINAPEFTQSVEIRLVELFAAALDSDGRAVTDLVADDFAVYENDEPQALLRFEALRDLPLHVGLLIDTSASMADNLTQLNEMAHEFLEQTIGPRDRAAVITFSEQPRLAAPFTNDRTVLSSALAGLRPERGTALWDSLVYAIDYFGGVKGQRALVVLSDGEDRRSRHTIEEVVRFAQGTGVTVYTVALESQVGRAGRRNLNRLAEATGGRGHFIRRLDELGAVYERIQDDLRSRYLLSYQSSSADPEAFRAIEVRLHDAPDISVRALAGYYP